VRFSTGRGRSISVKVVTTRTIAVNCRQLPSIAVDRRQSPLADRGVRTADYLDAPDAPWPARIAGRAARRA
jgi:hypothetical protein